MQTTFLMQALQRLQSENPKFWKILSTVGAILAILIAGILFLEKYEIIKLTSNWQDMLKAIDGFFVGVFFSGQLGTTDSSLVDPKTKQNIMREKQ